MIFNRLAFGAVALACVAAAGVGGYVADTRTGLDHDFTPDLGYLGLAEEAVGTRWFPYRDRWTKERVAKVREAALRIFTGDVECLTDSAPAGSRLGYTTHAPPPAKPGDASAPATAAVD